MCVRATPARDATGVVFEQMQKCIQYVCRNINTAAAASVTDISTLPLVCQSHTSITASAAAKQTRTLSMLHHYYYHHYKCEFTLWVIVCAARARHGRLTAHSAHPANRVNVHACRTRASHRLLHAHMACIPSIPSAHHVC